MKGKTEKPDSRSFAIRLVLPVALAIGLFVTAIFAIVLPQFSSGLEERKREMIHELSECAWNTLLHYESRVQKGELTLEEAQDQAIQQIRNYRYGPEHRDYFWIFDFDLNLIMHPYREDLVGKNQAELTDANGTLILRSFRDIVMNHHEGYMKYLWQYHDDENRIVPKVSFVKGFDPWGWIVGTGMYLEDVHAQTAELTGKFIYTCLAIFFLLVLTLIYMMRQSLAAEHKRLQTERALMASEKKYHDLFDNAPSGAMLLDKTGRILLSNAVDRERSGYTRQERQGKMITDFLAEWSKASFDNLLTQLNTRPLAEKKLIFVTKEGASLARWCKATPVHDDEGRFNGAVMHMIDMTGCMHPEQEATTAPRQPDPVVAPSSANPPR
jgi:PAS domain S-box-containing protein